MADNVLCRRHSIGPNLQTLEQPMCPISRIMITCGLWIIAHGGGVSALADEREVLVGQGVAHWMAGHSPAGSRPWRPEGDVQLGQPEEGTGARPGARVARLRNGWFDAGPDLNLEGSACTVHIRLRDPHGNWRQAFVAKRGSVEDMNINFFASQYPGKPCPEVAFEVRTDAGFGRVHFLIDSLDRTAWHDLVARYDGQRLELFCDGKWMAGSRHRGELHVNSEPLLVGAWTDAGQTVFRSTGDIEEVTLWNRSLTDEELAHVMRCEAILRPAARPVYRSPVHYRPEGLILADTIPFFWKGEYHIFYLRSGEGGTPWGHVVSRDLVHWTELPDALPLGKPHEPDGENVFTGSVIEHDGTFHIFYTGWNPRLPVREQVMHATSRDLIHWDKAPQDSFTADGIHYAREPGPDFRDPYVFRNPGDGTFWMLLCARRAADQSPVTGLATSRDLIRWQQQPALASGYRLTPECPDLFSIGKRWYLIVSPSENVTVYRTANSPTGPWSDEPHATLDTPILYAAKRMDDGRRHVLTGWLRDLEGDRDSGAFRWGGTQSIPREVSAGPAGELLVRPVPEVVARFTETVAELKDLRASDPPQVQRSSWPLKLAGGVTSSPVSLEVPDHYLLEATVDLDSGVEVAFCFREGPGLEPGYQLVLRPDANEVELRGAHFRYRRAVPLPEGQPVSIQAFVLGTTIECFINDSYALSARAYDRTTGRLGIQAAGGSIAIREFRVKIAEPRE